MSPAGDLLAEDRRKAWDAYRSAPLPDRVAHVWRYTDPKLFALPEAQLADRRAAGMIAAEPGGPAGVEVTSLWDAAGKHADLVKSRLGALVPAAAGKLEALNLARWHDGLLVRVPKGRGADQPLVLTSKANGEGFSASRLIVEVEDGADLTLIRQFQSAPNAAANAQINGVIEVFAGANSRVRVAVVQELAPSTLMHLNVRAQASHGANVETIVCSLGAGTVKADVGAILAGEGAQSESWGVIMGDEMQHFDHHTVHEHRAGRTRSNFDYKTVLRDKAHSVYTGLIRIDAHAMHCEAYQENRNLMLSETAKADSIPELEILNNEVRCTHGATMGPIEPEYIFYLMSRGLPRPDAIRMFVEGFVAPALLRLPENLQEHLREALDRRLERV